MSKLTLGKAAAAGDLNAVQALLAGKSKIDARTGTCATRAPC